MTTIIVTPQPRPNIIIDPPVPVEITVSPPGAAQGQPGPVGPAGPAGPQGQAADGAYYNHVQGVADTTWTIPHNLGFRPAVHLYDSQGDEFEGDIHHVDQNTVIVTLAYAVSGLATAS